MNAGMQCQVATVFATVASCLDFTGFSSDYFQCKIDSFQTKLSLLRGIRTGPVAFEATLWQNLNQLYAK